MLKSPLFKEMFVLLAIVGVVNAIAVHFFLYWKISRLDSFVHFTAGAVVSSAFLWLYFYSGLFKASRRGIWNFILVSLLAIIFVGVAWETYELGIGDTSVTDPGYLSDTIMDLTMDLLGALGICFYGYIKELGAREASPS